MTDNGWSLPEFPESVPKTPLQMISLAECESMFDELFLRGLQEHYKWSDEETERVKQLAIDVGIFGIYKAKDGEQNG